MFKGKSIPRYGIALLEGLRFREKARAPFEFLEENDWKKLLQFCDTAQLTLIVGHICRPSLPEWVRTRIDKNHRDNAERYAHLKAAFLEMASFFSSRQIDFALLKGFAHAPDFTPDPLLRAQGDIDLWCLPPALFQARDALSELGYRPIGQTRGRHLPPMTRETQWEWRGDYFAVDLPIPVDLHYKLWDEEMESIAGPPEYEFWSRRSFVEVDGRKIPVLCLPDALAFSTLHLLMHLLHGDLRLQRAWEIAHFLDKRAADDDFWRCWAGLHSEDLRRLEVIIFNLAAEWFGCRLPGFIEEEIERLPADIRLWTQHYGLSPIEALFTPNKDELWLNICLLKSAREKRRIFFRRVLPLPTAQLNGNSEIRPGFLFGRVLHHARAFVPSCVGALKWWWVRQQLSRDFLQFLFASALFDIGEFIFFLLYNLYLLDRGYDEKVLGRIAGALTAGTFIGVIPAAAISRRFGLRGAVITAIIGTTAATTLRALVLQQPALLGSAFLNGLFMSLWAVCLPPAVAGFTTERSRPLAFSLITSIGIGTGVLAGYAGGHLPAWLIHFHLSISQIAAKRAALLIGSAIAALAIVPASALRFRPLGTVSIQKRTYPRGKFICGFLLAFFIWSLGTGGFNPFFNAYFAQHLHFSLEHIGGVFSYAQLTQVVVILLAPAVLKKMGEVRSIAAMQIATAAMLAVIAIVSNPVAATFVYTAYMSFQSMSEPCLLNMLMNHVSPSEQSGASALNFLIASLAGIIAATTAGVAITNFGYPLTVAACAMVTCAAGLLFSTLVRDR